MKWHTFFPDTPLSYPPSFDARVILYPDAREVRDYFSWRQADSVFSPFLRLRPTIDRLSAHTNNLYNTVFWAIIQNEGQSATQAHEVLRVRSTWPLL
jgi:tRNA(His) guanylyltransferase